MTGKEAGKVNKNTYSKKMLLTTRKENIKRSKERKDERITGEKVQNTDKG
jgi:hypothetical protein